MNGGAIARRDDAARRAASAYNGAAAARVRDATLAGIAGVHEIEVNVVYAVARKPAASDSGNPS
jgi:hypothetical protein